MPPIVQRWLAILGIGLALFGLGFVKGCEHERDKWEALSAKAEAEAEKVTAERIRKLAEQVAKYEKDVKDANAANSRNLDLIRRLRDASANLPRDTTSPSPSKGGDQLANVFGECAVALGALAKSADTERSKAELCTRSYQTIYESQSIRKRK